MRPNLVGARLTHDTPARIDECLPHVLVLLRHEHDRSHRLRWNSQSAAPARLAHEPAAASQGPQTVVNGDGENRIRATFPAWLAFMRYAGNDTTATYRRRGANRQGSASSGSLKRLIRQRRGSSALANTAQPRRRAEPLLLVVIASLEHHEIVAEHLVNEPMLLGDAP
jgi:hypothetical protein